MKRVILIAIAAVALIGESGSVFADVARGGLPRQHPVVGGGFAAFGKDQPVFGKDGEGAPRGAPWIGCRCRHGRGHGEHAMKWGGWRGWRHGFGKWGRELGLTDEQKAKLKEAAKAAREKNKANRQAFREEMRAALEKILNAEQKAKLEKFLQARRDRKGGEKNKDAPAPEKQPQPQQAPRQQNFGPRR